MVLCLGETSGTVTVSERCGMNPRGQGVDDDLVNLGLILIAAVGVIAAILRLAGIVAAWLSGAAQPSGGWEAGFRVLSHPGDPATALGADGLAAWVYWLVLVLMVAAVVASASGVVAAHRLDQAQDHRTTRAASPASPPARDVRAVASQKALLVARPDPAAVARQARAVRHRLPARPLPGQGVWASVEDSILLLGPPRSGKGLHVVINAILDAPGAVITTATRPDNIAATLTARQDARPSRGLRPPTPGRGTARGPALVTRARLRGPAHRDDPRHRPRLRHRPVDRRRRVRRVLGRQDPHRTPSPAPRSRPRRPYAARAVRLDALTLGRRRRRRDPVEQPRRPHPAGPTRWSR